MRLKNLLLEMTLTIIHEEICHAIDDVDDGKNNVPTGKEHADFYSMPEYYETHSTTASPSASKVDPNGNSEASKAKKQIVETINNGGNK